MLELQGFIPKIQHFWSQISAPRAGVLGNSGKKKGVVMDSKSAATQLGMPRKLA
jgi:hypothetical protein